MRVGCVCKVLPTTKMVPCRHPRSLGTVSTIRVEACIFRVCIHALESLACCGMDVSHILIGTALLWDAATGKQLLTLSHECWVNGTLENGDHQAYESLS